MVIKFSCKNCGQKISVPDVHAGKKGKCPKCKTIVIVPQVKSAADDYENLASGEQLEHSSSASDLQLKKEPPSQTGGTYRVFTNDLDTMPNQEQIAKIPEDEKPPERKLPWILDIFLYPTSTSGLINLGIFWILPILLEFTRIILPIIPGLAGLVVAGYMYYYFMECIRDSAAGGIRAPENIGSMPDMGDVVTQIMEIIASVVIFWGPLGAYLLYKIFWQATGDESSYNLTTDMVFWLLLGYGIFFFPIGLLALAMFGSSSAFNPVLWIVSIFSAFFQYCSLVLFFCVLVWLFSRMTSVFQQSLFFSYLFGAVFVYLAMVASHLLGRFYYLNSEKLNW